MYDCSITDTPICNRVATPDVHRSHIMTSVEQKKYACPWKTMSQVCRNCLSQSEHIIRNKGGSSTKDIIEVRIGLIQTRLITADN